SKVIAPTNGSASKKPSTGSGRRTGSPAVAVNVPRNAVCAKKYRNRETKPICDARRTQTKARITLRAGMPEPGSFLAAFLGLVGALGPPLLTNVADADAGCTAAVAAQAFGGADAEAATVEFAADASADAVVTVGVEDAAPARRI